MRAEMGRRQRCLVVVTAPFWHQLHGMRTRWHRTRFSLPSHWHASQTGAHTHQPNAWAFHLRDVPLPPTLPPPPLHTYNVKDFCGTFSSTTSFSQPASYSCKMPVSAHLHAKNTTTRTGSAQKCHARACDQYFLFLFECSVGRITEWHWVGLLRQHKVHHNGRHELTTVNHQHRRASFICRWWVVVVAQRATHPAKALTIVWLWRNTLFQFESLDVAVDLHSALMLCLFFLLFLIN